MAKKLGVDHRRPGGVPPLSAYAYQRSVSLPLAIGGNAELAGNKAKRCVREDLPGPQQAARVTESAELQRKAELIGVAAAALYGGEIGGTQGPVLDQFGFGGRQGKQHLDLLAGNGAEFGMANCPK